MSRPMRREEAVVEAPVTTVTVSDYAHQAYMILLVAFVVAPIVAGIDKYTRIPMEIPHSFDLSSRNAKRPHMNLTHSLRNTSGSPTQPLYAKLASRR